MTAATLPAVYFRFLDVVAAGDSEGFLDLFSGNGAVNDWGHIYVGRNAIRAWSDREFLGVNVTLDVSKTVEIDGRVTITAQVGGHGFNGPSTFVLVAEPDGNTTRELLIAA